MRIMLHVLACLTGAAMPGCEGRIPIFEPAQRACPQLADYAPSPPSDFLSDCSSIITAGGIPSNPAPTNCIRQAVPSICPNGGNAPGMTVSTQNELEVYRGCSGILPPSLVVTGSVCSLGPLLDVTVIDTDLVIGSVNGIGEVAIQNFEGLNNVRTIAGDLELAGLPHVTSLSGFDALRRVGSDVELRNMPLLAHLSGPPFLEDIGGELRISFNGALLLVDGFPELRIVGSDASLGPGSGLHFEQEDEVLCIGGFAELSSVAIVEVDALARLIAAPGFAEPLHGGTELQIFDAPSFEFSTLPPLDCNSRACSCTIAQGR